ncbi:MAG: efflux RND transporter periplasmic adaptor subunit [Fimbriimonadales bacterium]
MKRTITIFVVVFSLLFLAWWFFLKGSSDGLADVTYRTAEVERGDVVQSFSATGVLQPLTVVDVKSKAGGEVVALAVEEGTLLKRGDLVARIDPRDTQAIYEQAVADMTSTQARKNQINYQLLMQISNSETDIKNAESQLRSSRIQLLTLEARAKAQPELTEAAISQAQASYEVSSKDLDLLRQVTIPETRSQVRGDLDSAKAQMDAALANRNRNKNLLAKGYVSAQAAEAAESAYQAALASHRNAQERQRTLESNLQSQLVQAEARQRQAMASLQSARTNSIEVGATARQLQQAREDVQQAETAIVRAKANKRQVDVSRNELKAADAAIIRSKVERDNAKVQLDSTTVVSPRDGVVILKYLEEGTIIPPGTSVFSEGTSIVQIADVSKMYVEVQVDEADIAAVKVGQHVNVRLESTPEAPLQGKVSRVNPGAVTGNGVTQIKVRVEIEGSDKVKLMPGLNASCEFIQREKKDVLMIPAQAIKREEGKTMVEIMPEPNKPQKKEVEVGSMGNGMLEIVSGLSEGDVIVTSKIDNREIEDQQRRMEEAAQQRSPMSGPGTGGRR